MAELPDTAKTEFAILAKTNEFRRENGLAPVVRNAALETAARLFAEYLARTGRFAHEADGRLPADRTQAAGYRHCIVAENLALNLDSRGFKAEVLAGQAVQGWKDSPGHRRNMLLSAVTEIGVGVAQAPGPDPKFLSVQLFGRPDTLTIEFQIENRSKRELTYAFRGEQHTLEAGVIATHKACEAAPIVFERAGSWLLGQRLDTRFDVTDRTTFVARQSPDQKVRVEVSR